MKREQLEYIVLISIGCIAVLYVCFVFLLKPQWGKLKKDTEQQSQLTIKLEKAQGKIRRLPALKKSVKAFQDEVSKEEKKLLDNEFKIFVKMVKNATEKSGLKLNKIQPRNDIAIQRSKFYTEKWVVLETKAPYHVLGKWLYELEKQSSYIRIVNLSVKAHKKDMGIHNAKVTVGFLTKSDSK
jgi:Tfp pilus assembly protein PilO